MESVWVKPFICGVEDAAEEPTMCRKNAVLHVATENPQRLSAIRGRTRNLLAKEYANLHFSV